MDFNTNYDLVNKIEVETGGLIIEINNSEEHISVELALIDGVITLIGEDLQVGSHIVLSFQADIEGSLKSIEIMAKVTQAHEDESKLRLLNVRSIK
jgi:hypothetical protein